MMKQSHSVRAALGNRMFDNYMRNKSNENIDDGIEGTLYNPKSQSFFLI